MLRAPANRKSGSEKHNQTSNAMSTSTGRHDYKTASESHAASCTYVPFRGSLTTSCSAHAALTAPGARLLAAWRATAGASLGTYR